MDRQQKNNEDKMVSQKEEIIAEQRDTLSRLKAERDQLDGRYDAKKKHLKVTFQAKFNRKWNKSTP